MTTKKKYTQKKKEKTGRYKTKKKNEDDLQCIFAIKKKKKADLQTENKVRTANDSQ